MKSKICVRVILTFLLLLESGATFATRPDSVRCKIEDFDYLTRFVETNLATYPYIKKHYSEEYVMLKRIDSPAAPIFPAG